MSHEISSGLNNQKRDLTNNFLFHLNFPISAKNKIPTNSTCPTAKILTFASKLFLYSSSTAKVPGSVPGLIGNCVQFTSCPATVSNSPFLPTQSTVRLPADGKDGKNVTSQETCLHRMTMLPWIEADCRPMSCPQKGQVYPLPPSWLRRTHPFSSFQQHCAVQQALFKEFHH